MSASEPLATVNSYIEAFNDGDISTMASLFDDDGVILDGMAPHVWLGPDAVRVWYRDVMTESEHLGASGYRVTLGDALHHDVTAECAYLALPATMTFDLKGDPVTQDGASFTVALRRRHDGWRISAWAWTKGRPRR